VCSVDGVCRRERRTGADFATACGVDARYHGAYHRNGGSALQGMPQTIWALLLLAACALPCLPATGHPVNRAALATGGLIGLACTCAAAIHAAAAAT
jgi:hypothetical protein